MHPYAVWEWYLYRVELCKMARPNPGHQALADMESRLGDRFTPITQNVDNLPIRAGNGLSRTLQEHGNLLFIRCAVTYAEAVFPLLKDLTPKKESV